MGATRLRAMLAELFPRGVAVEVRELDSARSPGAEPRWSRDPRGRRDAEFAAGRAAARSALAPFGMADFEVGTLQDGAPSWPELFIGSISHSGDFAAAAVARRGEFAGIGIDLARERSLASDRAPLFARPSELRWLESLPEPSRSHWSFFLLATKESVRKCARGALGSLPSPLAVEIRVEPESGRLDVSVEGAAGHTWHVKSARGSGYLLVAAIARRTP